LRMGISILSDKSWTNDPPSVNQDVSHNIPKISLPIYNIITWEHIYIYIDMGSEILGILCDTS